LKRHAVANDAFCRGIPGDDLIYDQILIGDQIGEVRMPRRARRDGWTAADVPDQTGRTAVVTGSSGGIGLETARVLAERGADVVLACRDLSKAGSATGQIRAGAPDARVRVVRLDLASLASVREAGAEIRATCPRLDLLIDNAGVMAVPYRRTADGLESQLATNHLGHFALTGLVLDRLLATPGSRVVVVSSVAHRRGEVDWDDLQCERRYRPSAAYDRSKLANLLFAYELNRRLEAAGATTIALAAHPGIVLTGLWSTSSLAERLLLSRRLRLLNARVVQSAAGGALPTLRAAVDPDARGGDYFGPSGWLEYTGSPVRVASSERSHDRVLQRRLWEVSEQLTGVAYRVAAPSQPGAR
jgi:NAD(P)-dependent dehydrogenase (short-subunit alcohol dehydrogenase family)